MDAFGDDNDAFLRDLQSTSDSKTGGAAGGITLIAMDTGKEIEHGLGEILTGAKGKGKGKARGGGGGGGGLEEDEEGAIDEDAEENLDELFGRKKRRGRPRKGSSSSTAAVTGRGKAAPAAAGAGNGSGAGGDGGGAGGRTKGKRRDKEDSDYYESEEDGEDGAEEDEDPDAEALREEQEEQDRLEFKEKMRNMLGQMDDAQLRRYESYRRSALSKPVVKRLMLNVLGGQNVPPAFILVMAGIAKVYAGEVVEKGLGFDASPACLADLSKTRFLFTCVPLALDVKRDWKEAGPIRPRHLREAVRRLKKESVTENSARRLFR